MNYPRILFWLFWPLWVVEIENCNVNSGKNQFAFLLGAENYFAFKKKQAE